MLETRNFSRSSFSMNYPIILHTSALLVAVQTMSWKAAKVGKFTCRLPNHDYGNPLYVQMAVVICILILVSNQLFHLSWQKLLLCFVSKEIFGSDIATRSCCYYYLANSPNLCSPSKHPSDFEEFGNLIPYWSFTNNPSLYNGPSHKAKSDHAEPSHCSMLDVSSNCCSVSISVIRYCCYSITPFPSMYRKMHQTKTYEAF